MKKFSVRAILVIIGISVFVVLGIRILDLTKPEAATTAEKISTVQLLRVGDHQKPTTPVTAGGEISASLENEIRSEVGGKITKIFVQVGAKIPPNSPIAQLDTTSFDIQLNQAAAALERIRAQRSLQAAGARFENKESARMALEKAGLSLSQSREQLAQSQLTASENLRRAETVLAKVQNALSENETISAEAIKTAGDNLSTANRNALSAIDSSLLLMGNILGEEPGDSKANDAFESVLGVKSQAQRETFRQNFLDFRARFELFRREFWEQNQKSLTEPPPTQISLRLEEQLSKVETLLEANRLTVENTITQGAFDDRALSSLKNQLQTAINANNAQFNALSAARQRLKDSRVRAETVAAGLNLDREKAEQDLIGVRAQNTGILAVAGKAVEIQALAVKQAELTLRELENGPRAIDLAALDASAKEAEAAYRQIAANREKTLIKSNFAGTVAALPWREGEFIGPGQIFSTVVGETEQEIKVYLSNNDRETIDIDAPVSINNRFSGRITAVSPRLDPQKKQIEVRIKPAEAINLPFGSFVTVNFIRRKNEQTQNSFFVPFKSVKIGIEGAEVLLVNKENRLESLAVTLGSITGENIEILSGLKPETQIVASARGLNAGDQVRITAANTAPKVKVEL